MSLRLNNIDKIFDVTSKPLIMDIDTGGKLEHLKMRINSIEKLGISATARASLGVYNSKEDMDSLCNAIDNCKKVFDI